MQGIELVKLEDGRVFWFQSVQGMALVYEVTGWRSLRRSCGRVLRPPEARAAGLDGTGLAATYFRGLDGKEIALRATEPPIYFEPFGPPHWDDLPEPPWRVVWEGSIEPRVSDRYVFHAMRAEDERVTISVDGEEVFASSAAGTKERPVELGAAERHRLRIDFVNGAGRPELRVLWSGRVLDRRRLDAAQLHPAPATRR